MARSLAALCTPSVAALLAACAGLAAGQRRLLQDDTVARDAVAATAEDVPSFPAPAADAPAYATDRVLFKLKEGAERLESARSGPGPCEQDNVLGATGVHSCVVPEAARGAEGSTAGVDALIQELQADPSVEYAEPDYILYANYIPYIPTDKRYGEQWGFDMIGMPAAWDALEETGQKEEPIIVAVMDSGVDYNHPDLVNAMWTCPDGATTCTPGSHGRDTHDNDEDPMDGHGHGTHCAGTIAATHEEDFAGGGDVVGVNRRNVQIMALRVLGPSLSGYTSDGVLALEYAIANGAHLTSNSYGGGPFSQTEHDAIKKAAEANQLFIASAGNSAKDNDVEPRYPTGYDLPNVISVASSDENDLLSSFSCYGATTVDIAAPGSNILSSYHDGGYESTSGTSMACPHVAGAAAMILSSAAVPDMTYAELKEILLTTGDDWDGAPVSSGKRLNVENALAEAADLECNGPCPDCTRCNRATGECEAVQCGTCMECVSGTECQPITDDTCTVCFTLRMTDGMWADGWDSNVWTADPGSNGSPVTVEPGPDNWFSTYDETVCLLRGNTYDVACGGGVHWQEIGWSLIDNTGVAILAQPMCAASLEESSARIQLELNDPVDPIPCNDPDAICIVDACGGVQCPDCTACSLTTGECEAVQCGTCMECVSGTECQPLADGFEECAANPEMCFTLEMTDSTGDGWMDNAWTAVPSVKPYFPTPGDAPTVIVRPGEQFCLMKGHSYDIACEEIGWSLKLESGAEILFPRSERERIELELSDPWRPVQCADPAAACIPDINPPAERCDGTCALCQRCSHEKNDQLEGLVILPYENKCVSECAGVDRECDITYGYCYDIPCGRDGCGEGQECRLAPGSEDDYMCYDIPCGGGCGACESCSGDLITDSCVSDCEKGVSTCGADGTTCVPDVSAEACFALTMSDSGNDGWNGNAFKVVALSSGDVPFKTTLRRGGEAVKSFCLPTGETYRITVRGGNKMGEVSWSLAYDRSIARVDASDAVIMSGGAPFRGPLAVPAAAPAAGQRTQSTEGEPETETLETLETLEAEPDAAAAARTETEPASRGRPAP